MQYEESGRRGKLRTWQATALALLVAGLSIVGFATQSRSSDADPGRAATQSFANSARPACSDTVPLPKVGAVCHEAQPHRARFTDGRLNQDELRRHGLVVRYGGLADP